MAKKNPRFDQEYDGVLKIQSGLSANNKQGKALAKAVEDFNAWIKTPEAQGKGYLPVVIETTTGGYTDSYVKRGLNSRDKTNFYNMTINYPAVASLLAQYNMTLPFTDEEYNALGIASAYKGVNEKIGGNTKKEILITPIGSSTEMNAVNSIVLGYFLTYLSELVVDGQKLITISDTNNTNLTDILSKYKAGTADAAYVKKLWDSTLIANDDTPAYKDAIAFFKGKTYDDTLLTNYTDLIQFATNVRKIFRNTPPNTEMFVLGIDSLITALNVMATSLTNGQPYKDGFITLDPRYKGTGGYNFVSFFQKPESPQYKVFEKFMDLIIPALQTKALFIGGGGSYGSDKLVNHKMAMNIGSTAGYDHTFKKGDSVTIYSISGLELGEFSKYNNTIEPKSENAPKGAVAVFGSKDNPIFESAFTGELGKYDKQSANKESDDILKSITGKNYFFQLPAGAKVARTDTGISITANETVTQVAGVKLVTLKNQAGDDSKWIFAPESTFTKETKTSDAILNEVEAAHLPAPQKFEASDQTSAVFIQGPSIVPIHANEKEDIATKLFINWLYTNNQTEPAVATFALKGNYVPPLQAVYSGDLPTYMKDKISIKSIYLTQKFIGEVVKSEASGSKSYIFAEDAPTAASSIMRDAIGATGRATMNRALNGEKISFDQFIAALNKNGSINQ